MFMNSKSNNQPTHENFSKRKKDTKTRVSARSIKMDGLNVHTKGKYRTHSMPDGPEQTNASIHYA